MTDLRAPLLERGFKKRDQHSFVRSLDEAGIEHIILAEPQRAFEHTVQVSVAVRHLRTERLLVQFFEMIECPTVARGLESVGSTNTMGRTLGLADSRDFSVYTDIEWFGELPATYTTLSDAICRMDALESLSTIHDAFKADGSFPSTWILRTELGWARDLLIAIQVGAAPSELNRIAEGMSRDRTLAHFPFAKVAKAAAEAAAS